MQAETFFKTMVWLQGACAIQHPPMKGMIDILFNELKDKFTDNELRVAARQIAEKEDLYGNYPSLRVWLKHCPQTKAIRSKNDKLKTQFLDEVSAVMWLDHMLYDHSETEKQLKTKFGWHGFNAFQRTGISLQNLRSYYHTNDTQKKQVLEKFARAWDETENKNPNANDKPQITQAKPVQLPKG